MLVTFLKLLNNNNYKTRGKQFCFLFLYNKVDLANIYDKINKQGDYMKKNIFNFLEPLNNNELSKLDSKDREQILKYINEYFLEYRESLFFEKNITFGTEIEFDESSPKFIKKQLSKEKLKTTWLTKTENSITEGGEVVSPILTNTKDTWINLKKVCDILKENANNTKFCGAHIHVGSNILENDINNWLNFIYLWSAYENIIFRFSCGEFLTPRPNIMLFSSALRVLYEKKYNEAINKRYSLQKLIDNLNFRRDLAVNLQNVSLELEKIEKNTIEFRCPNGTFNEIIWQNNINFFINLLLYSKNKSFDLDKIEYRNKKAKLSSSNIAYYNELYLDEALELADLIFEKNIDKIYFLRQYIKNYQVSYEPLKRAKTFTK